MNRFLKGFLLSLSTLLLGSGILYATMFWQNNRDVPAPSNEQYKEALEHAISWVEDNQEELLKTNNSILWSFINDAYKLNMDVRLLRLVHQYTQRPEVRRDLHYNFFEPGSHTQVDGHEILGANIPLYNIHFMYALSCNQVLGDSTEIQRQLKSDFCRWSPIISSCTTHQLMGMDYMLRNNCGDIEESNILVADLQEQIKRQLILDPRVGDVYIQRLMMLATTGEKDALKNIWLRRMLNAQLDNGAWEQFHPLLSIGGGYRFGFAYQLPKITQPSPNFHITAQAILLLSKLLNNP